MESIHRISGNDASPVLGQWPCYGVGDLSLKPQIWDIREFASSGGHLATYHTQK